MSKDKGTQEKKVIDDVKVKVSKGFHCTAGGLIDVDLGFFLNFTITGPVSTEVKCLGVDEYSQAYSTEYVISKTHLETPNSEVKLTVLGENLFKYKVSLKQLPAAVVKLLFVVRADGSKSLQDIEKLSCKVFQEKENRLLFELKGSDFEQQKNEIIFSFTNVLGTWQFVTGNVVGIE